MNDVDAFRFVGVIHELKSGPLTDEQVELADFFYSLGLRRGRNTCGRFHIGEAGIPKAIPWSCSGCPHHCPVGEQGR